MINVLLQTDCIDIPSSIGDAVLTLEDKACVRDMLRKFAELEGAPVSYPELIGKAYLFVIENRFVTPDEPLKDGDRILLLRAMAGG